MHECVLQEKDHYSSHDDNDGIDFAPGVFLFEKRTLRGRG
jgi:hypothetical protein